MPAGSALLDTVPALLAALAGTGPIVRPVGAESPAAHVSDVNDDTDEPLAFAVATSGSSGNPRHALLTAGAIRHASAAGERALGHPTGWLLALPTTGVGGLMVLLRAALAGRTPGVLDTSLPFTAERFVAAAATVPDGAAVSLVPTQLHRLLADPSARDALQRFGIVLIGGAALPPADLHAAADHGIRLVRSYGMTETCGGCVYDGRPLDGVTVDLDDGRLRIRGPLVAAGYLGRPYGSPFGTGPDGARTFTTGDTGCIADDGTITVTGRADDVLISGGVNVAPLAVEHALSGAPGVAEVGITAVPDPEWGQAVVAVVVPAESTPELAELRRRASAVHPAAAPRHLLLVDALPIRGPGKLDRRALAELAARQLAH